MPDLGVNAAAQLSRDRANMIVFRRAFRAALQRLPAPPYAHMLAAFDLAVTAARAADPYDPLVQAADNVTQFERTHPDMAEFAAGLGISDAQIDTIFKLAMAIETQATEAELNAIANG